MGGMTPQERQQAAVQLAREGNLAAALALVDQAPAQERDGLLDLRINLLKGLQETAQMVDIRRAQLQQQPASMVAHHNLASALGDAGQNTEAEAMARRALELGGNAPETWLVLARALQAQRKSAEAQHAYREVLSRRSDYLEAVNELSQNIWMSGGEIAEARQPYEQALAKHPSHLGLLRGLAVFNEYVGMDARTVWQDLMDRARKALVHSAALELAACHLALKFDPKLALSHAERAVDMAQQEVPAWTMLAQCLLINGRAREALEILPELLRVTPLDQSLLAYHATAVRLLGQADRYGLDNPQGIIAPYTIDTPKGWNSLSDYLADLKIALENQHSYNRHPIGQSLRHGSQTPVDLRRVDDPAIQAFFEAIEGPIKRHLEQLGQGSDPVRALNKGGYRITGCWSVRLGSGGFHESHIHPKGWLSSACYIDLPDAVNNGGTEGWIGFGVPPFALNPPLEPLTLEKPEPGKLVLFPSCMWHGTLPFTDERPRLTIAFDLVPA